MAPLDFIAGFLAGSIITALAGVVILAIFAARHAGTPHNLELLLGILRDLRDIATGILHALQILAGTRSVKPPPRPESPRPG